MTNAALCVMLDAQLAPCALLMLSTGAASVTCKKLSHAPAKTEDCAGDFSRWEGFTERSARPPEMGLCSLIPPFIFGAAAALANTDATDVGYELLFTSAPEEFAERCVEVNMHLILSATVCQIACHLGYNAVPTLG